MRINPWLVVTVAVIVLAGNMGIRQSMGLLNPAIVLSLDVPMAEIAFGYAVQNLLWGAVSPIAGLFAERYGTVRILLGGILLYAAGLVVAAISESSAMFFFGNALLIGVGVGATAFPIVLGVVGKRFDEKKRTLALGIASAGGSLGQFLYSLLVGYLQPSISWPGIFLILAATLVLAFLLSGLLREPAKSATSVQVTGFDWSSIGRAFQQRDYLLLNIGFFVCGFHIAFLSVHMAGMVSLCGLPTRVATDSLALIGLVNVAGTILSGWAGGRWHQPYLLSIIYLLRAIIITALLLLLPTPTLFYIFSAAMGMLWLSTVPLTSGCVAQLCGTRNLATLFGVVMFSHQIGAFVGSWWGGVIYDQSGSYDSALFISAVLGLLAALIHLPISPQRLRLARMRTAQAS